MIPGRFHAETGATIGIKPGETRPKSRPLAERFWEKVDRRGPEECWPWMASGSAVGYGQFWVNGTYRNAPRVAVQLTGREIPRGFVVMHTCDNPPCVNPAHLVVASQSENLRDMHAKGRGRKDNNQAQETRAKLAEIVRKRWASYTPEERRARVEATKRGRANAANNLG